VLKGGGGTRDKTALFNTRKKTVKKVFLSFYRTNSYSFGIYAHIWRWRAGRNTFQVWRQWKNGPLKLVAAADVLFDSFVLRRTAVFAFNFFKPLFRAECKNKTIINAFESGAFSARTPLHHALAFCLLNDKNYGRSLSPSF
jgi:hypothetical protein